jgi:hypothetical protein
MNCPHCGSQVDTEWVKCEVCGVSLHSASSQLWWKVIATHPLTGERLEPRPFSRREYAEIHAERLRRLGYIDVKYFPSPWGKDPNQLEVIRPRARRPEVIPVLNPIDAAQLAQLIMDEGYLRYQRSPKVVHDIYDREYWGYYPRLRIAKTDREDIEHFAEILSATAPYIEEIASWRIELAGEKLTAILRQIRPYIRGEKAPQIDIILEHGKFYIPNTTIPKPPTILSLVEPEKLMEHLKMKTPITPHIKGVSPTPTDIQTMRTLRTQGLTIDEIAELTGFSKPTVIKYLREKEVIT